MIKEKSIEIRAFGRNLPYLRKIKYVSNGDIVIIDVKDLWRNCHCKITAICDVCQSEKSMTYQEYQDYIEKSTLYYCKSCFNKHRMPEIVQIKYGTDNYNKSDVFKNIVNNRTEEEIDAINDKRKNTKIKNGWWLSVQEINEFKTYRKVCHRITLRNKKELFENWNGYDFYDNEYIKDYLYY